jgi:hypothetical protein
MLATTKAGIETIGRPSDLSVPISLSSFSLYRLSTSSTAIPLLRVCVYFSISCQPYLVGDKLHHVLLRLRILQRIHRRLAQYMGYALYDQYCGLTLIVREATMVVAG